MSVEELTLSSVISPQIDVDSEIAMQNAITSQLIRSQDLTAYITVETTLASPVDLEEI